MELSLLLVSSPDARRSEAFLEKRRTVSGFHRSKPCAVSSSLQRRAVPLRSCLSGRAALAL